MKPFSLPKFTAPTGPEPGAIRAELIRAGLVKERAEPVSEVTLTRGERAKREAQLRNAGSQI